MEEKIIKQILEKTNIRNDVKDEYISFSDKRYKSVKLDKKNFDKISKADFNKKIAFVDGGNSEILRLANLSLQLVRVYYSIFYKNKKVNSERFDFYVLVEAVDNGDGISYNISIAPNNFLDKLTFDSFDETLIEGRHRISVSKIGEVVRRFLELHLAKLVVGKLSEGDVIVLDGSLEAHVTNEANLFNELYKKASEKNVVVSGLSKTCTLLTNKGNSVISILRAISPEGAWYYDSAVEIDSLEHQADMFFARLHKNSKHIFRLEIFKNNKYNINEVLNLLMENSKDPVFLGYPYGLIDADKFARVSNNEKEYLKTMLRVKLKREDLGEQSIDAHSILDSVG